MSLDTNYQRQEYKENLDFVWHNKNKVARNNFK